MLVSGDGQAMAVGLSYLVVPGDTMFSTSRFGIPLRPVPAPLEKGGGAEQRHYNE